MPVVKLSSSSDATAAWTGFFDTNVNTIRSFLDRPPSCNAPGEAAEIPMVTVGDQINLTTGVTGSVFDALGCWFVNDIDDREYVVPVVDIGECTSSLNATVPVTGFVSVRMQSVVSTGTLREATFATYWNPAVPSQPGTDGCP